MRYGTGVALVLLAGLIWSSQGLVVRQIATAGTWELVFWRAVGMVPVMAAGIAIAGRGRIPRIGWAGVIGGLSLAFAFTGAIHAFRTTSIANAVFLFSASPFFAAAVGWLVLHEPVRRATWAAILLALAGIAVMVREGLAAGQLEGNLAALASGAGFAIYTICLRWEQPDDRMPVALLGGLFSALIALCAVGGPALVAVAAPDIVLAVGLGAVTLAGGLLLYTAGARVLPAAEATLLSLIEVLLAPIWAFLVLGETLSEGTWLGGAILIAAVALNATSGGRAPAPRVTS